ncbi:MAG: hypothetical protein GTO51_03305 [Candidatus Latescibacteria bacterium]|nr:hypothetical protein [Candidatus Latescibacterota bacterium]NIM22713.1 hypothetical protein [Candidatus Latescibacterota bacterium]NIM65002.1 hypothetical protein [Candidatus Latescibacterota bacterium]NIO01517.1 hypothetical protein [Candidatus Latescibacterota bacterium]NIO28026.1 hypothetical protein [Candidatus Latescibacterota bacterium]
MPSLKNIKRETTAKLSIFGELWAFMRVRKKWWLGPIFFFLLILSLLIIFTEGSALAPFIYALF